MQLFWRAVGSIILRPMEEKNETLLDGGTLTELILMILYDDIIINTYFLFVLHVFIYHTNHIPLQVKHARAFLQKTRLFYIVHQLMAEVAQD